MKELIYKSEKLTYFQKIFRNFRFFWGGVLQKFTNLGVHSSYPTEYNYRIRLFNYFAVVFFLVSQGIRSYFFSSSSVNFFFSIFSLTLTLGYFLFGILQKHSLAKSILFLQVLSFVVFLNMQSAGYGGWIFYFLPIFLLNFILFCPIERKFSYVYSFLNLLAMLSFLLDKSQTLDFYVGWNRNFYDSHFFFSTLLLVGGIVLFVKRYEFTIPISRDAEFTKLLQAEVFQRQKMEESWSEALLLQSEIMNAIPSDVLILNYRGEIVRLNQIKERFLKESLEDSPNFGIGSNFFEYANLIYKNCSLPLSNLFHATIQVLSGKTNFQEIEFHSSHRGELEWYKLKISKIEFQSFRGAFLMLVNYTEQKKGEEAIRKMERLNTALKTLVNDLMFSIDSAGNVFDFLSDGDLQFFENKNLGKSHILEFGLPDSVAFEIIETAQQALKYGSYHIVEFQISEDPQSPIYKAKIIGIDEKHAFTLIQKNK